MLAGVRDRGIALVPFQTAVASTFGFLQRDYGFAPVDRADVKVGEFAEYRKDPLTVTIGWYKGEIDVNFTIALDYVAGHAVFRPYLSRMFALYEIATRQNPAARLPIAVATPSPVLTAAVVSNVWPRSGPSASRSTNCANI